MSSHYWVVGAGLLLHCRVLGSSGFIFSNFRPKEIFSFQVPHDEAVEGKIDAFSPYEKIGDLDRALEGDDSGNMQNMAVDGYAICPIVEEPET